MHAGTHPELLILLGWVQCRHWGPLSVRPPLALNKQIAEGVVLEVLQCQGGACKFGVLRGNTLIFLALLFLLLASLLLLFCLLLFVLLAAASSLGCFRSRCRSRRRRRSGRRLRLRLGLLRGGSRRLWLRLRRRRLGGGLRRGDIADLVVARPGPADHAWVGLAERVHACLLEGLAQRERRGDVGEREALADEEGAGLELRLEGLADQLQGLRVREVVVVHLQRDPFQPGVDLCLFDERRPSEAAVRDLTDPLQDGIGVADALARRQVEDRHREVARGPLATLREHNLDAQQFRCCQDLLCGHSQEICRQLHGRHLSVR
mmetsp:Transcript_137364/g.342579  ORF Transcript_137364/g.342579 Transcript_137364/m.342579 type:complete len:319 (+) Transcript_137364:1492-2448(+)